MIRKKLSPRQKMINLMYVVLMAMLALNVSSDVLEGFRLVDEGLNRTKTNSATQNEAIYKQLEEAMKQNPEKTRQWYDKAQQVRKMSDTLYTLAENLKWEIVREADGDDADLENIEGRDNLEAATHVMLAPGIGQGGKLKKAIETYRDGITSMINDEGQKKIIRSNLSTAVPKKAKLMGKNWQEYMFENTPVAAAVTLLTKLQTDVRHAEGEMLHQLVANIDVKDVRVNEIQALVIPTTQVVVRGGKFSAQIIMAAVDTTQRPEIYVGNTLLKSENGRYETICGSTGDFTLKGYLVMKNGNGETIRREFTQPYTVVEPSATVSATMMNMLYAGYQNPISVSVPGVPNNKISLSMSSGTLTHKDGNNYIAVPSKVGEDVTFTVTAQVEGRQQEMGKFAFRVRKLPDPTGYLEYTDAKGNTSRFKGGRISKQAIMAAGGIGAAIDDGLLDISFRVLGFQTRFMDNMGNVVPEVSNSASFTPNQLQRIRSLTRGKLFNISEIRVVGPDGIERTLTSPVEVIIN
ncbi:MAG: gliding motility protein GldM [Bacteroidaceae bacterium]|jgi:gliding motility-associated protein GldM|nr:gliding motility protein GldM [Bacteroidaceae bacterium]MBR3618623.1 gliding motility protein GldM [Bacteroidaceae bacterium]